MWPQGVYQGTSTSTVSSRLLFEAAAGLTKGPFPCGPEKVTNPFDFVVDSTDMAGCQWRLLEADRDGNVYVADRSNRRI